MLPFLPPAQNTIKFISLSKRHMNYNLNKFIGEEKSSNWRVIQKLVRLIREERPTLFLAFFVIICNSGLQLINPYIMGITIDRYIVHKDFHGVLVNAGIILAIALTAFCTAYAQARLMGGIGQRML